MKPYIIVPIEWIEKEIAMYGERIKEFNDVQFYTAKIMLLYKMMDEFKIMNEYYETRRESDSVKLCTKPTATRKPRRSSTRDEGEQSS